jgi:ubiquitin C-terminal hydrolase
MNEIKLTKEYAKLIKALWNTNSSIEPKSFHELIQKYDERFIGYEQQDSQESLSLILDCLHEGLKYDVEINYSGIIENSLDEIVVESIQNWRINIENKYSIISQLFFGQFINKIISLEKLNKNQLISKKFEMFNLLNIPIYGKTLYDSLSKYFEKEILDTKFLNEKTNEYIDTYREIKLMRIPKFLIIVLKRYKNNNGTLIKSNNLISFPIDDLDMSTYAEGYDIMDCNMKLISIGCHTGNLNGGHYFAICRHKNENWYKYDDDIVSEFPINTYKNTLFRDGYILIYEKNE